MKKKTPLVLGKRKSSRLNPPKKSKPRTYIKRRKNKSVIKTLQKYAIAVKVLNNAIEFEKNNSKND